MSSFSYKQHHSYLLNPTGFFPNPTTGATNTTSTADLFSQFHQHHDHHHNQVFVANKLLSPESSMSMVLDDQNLESGSEFLAKKRKDEQIYSSNQPQSKYTSNKLKKQKKTNCYQEEKKKRIIKKGNSEEEEEEEEEGAIGYIHVRAKRGQATDSHSLAERVRREKISERMKFLQSIVPGCDKVTGKALVLDEIISYVRSLRNQVEFLSMKLATLNPMSYDFGVDMDTFMLKPEENMISSMLLPIIPSVQRFTPITGGATTFAPMNIDNCNHLLQLTDGSAATNSLLFQPSQMPHVLSSQSQGIGHQFWYVDERRLKLEDGFALNNSLNSFH